MGTENGEMKPVAEPRTPRRRTRMWLAAATVTAAVLGSSAVAVATAPSGATGEIKAVGTFGDELDVKFKVRDHHGSTISRVKELGKAIVQQINVDPGGHTGWHSHGGPVVVIVQSGSLTMYSAEDRTCTGQTYGPGDAFVDPGNGHVHIARNEGSAPVVLWATYLLPADGAPRVDVNPAPSVCTG